MAATNYLWCLYTKKYCICYTSHAIFSL